MTHPTKPIEAATDLLVRLGARASDTLRLRCEDQNLVLASPGRGVSEFRFAVPTRRQPIEFPNEIGDLAGLLVVDDGEGVPPTLVARLARVLPQIDAVLLSLPPARFGEADLPMFDAGFVRVEYSDAAPDAPLYCRSGLVSDLGLLGRPTGGVVSMSTLGGYGRFANQLFQYLFLKLCGLRSNCAVQATPWIGNLLYGATAKACDPSLKRQIFPEFTGVERTLWYLDEPLINVDFMGFFQELPASWRLHKGLIRRLLTPIPEVSTPIDTWLGHQLPIDGTLVGIHIRRGDYALYDPVRVPWFRLIPVEWYLAKLQELWPTLQNPVLMIATDDPSTVESFSGYAPIIPPATRLAGKGWEFFPDFHSLCRSHVLLAVNSSFSRMAGLLGGDNAACFLPDMAKQSFEPYAPWDDENFWSRFEI